MIYNFNLGIGWASSGVEYAQSYRAAMLRRIGAPSRFIFTDMISSENIEHLTRNIGFEDEEVIWLYSFFTDFKIAPVSYTLAQLEESFGRETYKKTREGKFVRYNFEGSNNFYTAYMVNETEDRVHRVELVSGGYLIRKDFFTYGRVYSEYYAPKDGKAHLYQRRFFNVDGSLAYEEINDEEDVFYRFPDQLVFSKEELVGRMVRQLHPTEEDILIIDRTTGTGQSILMNAGKARVGIVIHADHFSENGTDENNILWNNYYEYAFGMHRHIDFYIASTEDQNRLVTQQFQQYLGVTPKVYTIPVGGLEALKRPAGKRRPFSVITASRLASEKHIDWIIQAIVKAHEQVPDITLDIYGKGGEEEKLRLLILHHKADSYIKLKGQHNLKEVYQNYCLYLSGSTSEGFGLTLMEAVGGGLPIIGFDVRYGNPTFIDDGENGYLIPVNDRMDSAQRVDALAEKVVELFTKADLEAFHEHAYAVASNYLTEEVEKRWKELIG